MTSIYTGAFLGCEQLNTVTIPKTTTAFHNDAFKDCDISSIIYYNTEPKKLNSKAFTKNTYENAILYIPKGTLEKYKSIEGWMNFKKIQESELAGIELKESESNNPIIFHFEGGRLIVDGLKDGTLISVYTTDGKQVGSAVSRNGAALVGANIQPGNTAIVKIGEKTVKVIVK